MAPLVRALKSSDEFTPVVCVTGQHREMLDQVLGVFGIEPDFDLDVMTPSQDLNEITSAVVLGLRGVLSSVDVDMTLVQGDTTSAMAAALGSFYARVPVGHVEAGLRTGDKSNPFPEELNRTLISNIADLHFAPTERSRAALLSEGVSESSVVVTGNTVVDALFWAKNLIDSGDEHAIAQIDSSLPDQVQRLVADGGQKIVLVTGHRRESFGPAFEQICQALKRLVEIHDDVQIVYPVHLNPSVRDPVFRILTDSPRVHLIEPVPYMAFTWLMMQCDLILTDSGGIQEEAPSLGKPVLVMRETTERPEGIEAGCARLVGTVAADIVKNATELLGDSEVYTRMSKAANPYGDGDAASRILEGLAHVGIRNG